MVELLRTATTKTGTNRSRHATAALVFLLVLSQGIQISTSMATENNPIITETLTLTVYLDGFVHVAHNFEINQTYPTVNIKLLGETQDNLLFLDDKNTPLDFAVNKSVAAVYSLGASIVRGSYLTQDLTTKTGQYWTLIAVVSASTAVVLPDGTTIISLSDVPEKIESTNGQVTLVMPPGSLEITYVTEHSPTEQTVNAGNSQPPWLLIASLSLLLIPAFGLVFLRLRHKKDKQSPEPVTTPENPEVDVEKLFAREKDLRQEEVLVIRFLAEKGGSAFEAELYEKLQLPRTTTWRLLKRLERMEIVDIKKSRRQNIVSIRKKYMKK